jgi:hypothetical protein
MTTKFLIRPLKTNALLREEPYKKGKSTFCIESKWKECLIIVDKKPKSKNIDSKKVTVLNIPTLIDHRYDYKKKLVTSDGMSDSDKKLIRKKYRDNDLYSIDDDGWKSSKEIYTLFGDFEIKEVPVHELTLFTSEVEGLVMSITKKQFDEYRTVGMPYSDYEEFEGSTEYCSPIFDEMTSLSVDDVEIPNFQKLFKQKYDQAAKEYEIEFPPSKKSNKKNAKSNLSYAVVGDRWIKRSWYKLTIYEEFDFSKIVVHISRDNLFGQNSYVETFTLSYGDVEFDFSENYGANADSEELMSSDGKRFDFEVLDEVYDEDEEEDEDDD